ncbi:MAG: hypothetical protein MUO63_12385 [Desulfobulbaceae bacterium]|nr:hypothetical protein [Desulfobulbaceae bacterium]
MAEKIPGDQMVSLIDALKVEQIVNQALIDLLVDKGIITHNEIMIKVKEIKVRDGILLSSDASKKASN